MVWWQQTMVWSGQTIVERRIRCRWLVAKRRKREKKRGKVARSSRHERQGERSSFCSKKKIEKKDAGVVYCLQNNKKAAQAAGAGTYDSRFYGMHKTVFAPLQTGLDNEREEQEPDNGGRPKSNFRIVWTRPEQRARSRVGRKGNGYADGGAQENVARIMDAEIHTTEAE